MLHFFARRLRELHEKDKKGEKGFTLIELLVVVIIIGILAAIAIPVFLQQRTRANGATCENDLRNGASAAQSYAADQPAGNYAGMTVARLQGNATDAPPGYEWNTTTGVTGTPTLTLGANKQQLHAHGALHERPSDHLYVRQHYRTGYVTISV